MTNLEFVTTVWPREMEKSMIADVDVNTTARVLNLLEYIASMSRVFRISAFNTFYTG